MFPPAKRRWPRFFRRIRGFQDPFTSWTLLTTLVLSVVIITYFILETAGDSRRLFWHSNQQRNLLLKSFQKSLHTYPIYYINMDANTDRRDYMERLFKGLNPIRIPATNGTDMEI